MNQSSFVHLPSSVKMDLVYSWIKEKKGSKSAPKVLQVDIDAVERANAIALLSVYAMRIFVVLEKKKMDGRKCDFDYFVTPSCSINPNMSATPQCSTPFPFSKRAM